MLNYETFQVLAGCGEMVRSFHRHVWVVSSAMGSLKFPGWWGCSLVASQVSLAGRLNSPQKQHRPHLLCGFKAGQ